jgi:hypothetical protein
MQPLQQGANVDLHVHGGGLFREQGIAGGDYYNIGAVKRAVKMESVALVYPSGKKSTKTQVRSVLAVSAVATVPDKMDP